MSKKSFLSKLDFADSKQGLKALFVGIFTALILSFLPTFFGWSAGWVYYLVFILGIVVGILNIFHKEAVLFVLSGLTLTLMMALLVNTQLFPGRAAIPFNAMICLLAPANIMVSLKVLYALTVK